MRILLVEDEPEMVANIRIALRRQDILLDHVSSLEFAREASLGQHHDAILLDRNLPDGDGLTLVSELRKLQPGVPIIVISALASSRHRIEGLDDGADDYLGKPFAVDELMARLRAVMRRNTGLTAATWQVGKLTFEASSRSATVSGLQLDMPRRELLVLEALMRRPGRTVSRESLEEAVYGFDDALASNAMEAHISRLRRRLMESEAGVEIHSVRGVGYFLRAIR